MERRAQTDYPVLEVIARRWSPTAFLDRPVEPAKLRSILEAARWAASSFNEQPWVYLVAIKGEQPQEFARMLSCLVEQNQRWARSAPVLMLSFAKSFFSHNSKPNRVAQHDVGAASASLTLQATELGLFVHQMAGIDIEKVRREYAVPQGYDPVAAVALGYAAGAEAYSEEQRQKLMAPRSRKPLREFVFSGAWGSAWPGAAGAGAGGK